MKPAVLWALGIMFSLHAVADPAAEPPTTTQKLVEALTPEELPEEPAAPTKIRQRAQLAHGLLEQREAIEKESIANPFVITPHHPNYFFPISFNPDPQSRSYTEDFSDPDSLDQIEFAFQLSVKFPVATSIVGKRSSLWFAYTQRAFWQAYNSEVSAPFRDTNHEPEAFIIKRLDDDYRLGGLLPENLIVGVNHQSNGQGEPLSRSWNRLYLNLIYEHGDTIYSFKPWYRFSEPSDQDDNPNIERYMGYGEFGLVHVLNDDYSLELMLRNNLREENKGAIQVGFNFPMWGKIRGYVQYFDGYGHSLLDYDNHTRSLGVGFMLTNWL